MQINIEKRHFNLIVGIMLVLGVIGVGMAVDTSGAFHDVSEVDWSSPIGNQLKISGSESGWGGWRYVMSLTSPGHAMIVFPESDLGFGMHKNGNFYWSYLGNYYPMRLTRTGDLIVRNSLTVAGKSVCLSNGAGCPDSGWDGVGSVPPQIVIPYKTNYVSKTRGYWSNGARYNDFNCDVPSKSFSGFTFVSDGEYVSVSGRGTCAKAPNCDSHGEYCHDFKVVKSCWINNEFYNWYNGQFGRAPPC